MSDRFAFTMPGQPPSWNHMYRRTTRQTPSGPVRIQVKTDDTNLYQSQLTMLARAAKPSDLLLKGQVLVVYDLNLGRDLDADNVMKAINDALAVALDVNDKRFLPVARSKSTGHRSPWVRISVYDAAAYEIDVVPL